MIAASSQVSKEETFESSSFFDEGVGSNRVLQSAQGMPSVNIQGIRGIQGYNLPTIFNTLMYGIDQNKVSPAVKESFNNLSATVKSGNPVSS